MLILIAGITGNIGHHAALHGLEVNHQIRGLGRNQSKLDKDLNTRLESFITTKSYDDITALNTACKDVDAVICAYSGMPELHLDAQLLLLRAAERAGVKRFLAAGWNYDWRTVPFGADAPIYDSIRAFHVQAEISSSIKPLHIFSGMLAEVFFGYEGQDGFTPRDGGVWDPKEKSMDVWGDGEGEWCFTTEEDAGRWGVEVVTASGAEDGGFVTLCSFRHSLMEVKAIYEKVRGTGVGVNYKGEVTKLEQMANSARDKHGRRGLWEWHRLFFHLFSVKGIWNLGDSQDKKYPNIKPTSLEAFLKAHPGI